MARGEPRLSSADLLIAVRFVELDAGERGLDLNTGRAADDGVRLGSAQERASDTLPGGLAPHVHRRAVQRPVDLIVAGEAKDSLLALHRASGNEEDLAVLHGVAIEVGADSGLPRIDGVSIVERRTERLDRVAVRLGDGLHIWDVGAANQEVVNRHRCAGKYSLATPRAIAS